MVLAADRHPPVTPYNGGMTVAAMLRLRAGATVLAVAVLVSAHAAPFAAQSAPAQGARPTAPPIPALGGVAGMKVWFNANAGHVRTVLLLSPT
jgi:hypothetical protein